MHLCLTIFPIILRIHCFTLHCFDAVALLGWPQRHLVNVSPLQSSHLWDQELTWSISRKIDQLNKKTTTKTTKPLATAIVSIVKLLYEYSTSNPARGCIFNKRFSKLHVFDKHKPDPSSRFPCSSDLAEIGFRQKTVLLHSVPPGPPWLYTSPSVDFSLHAFSKSDTSPEIFFLEFCENLHDHLHIYTDGSKANDKVAAAAVGQDVISSLRITNQASIFTAELVALNLSLGIMSRDYWTVDNANLSRFTRSSYLLD